MLLRLGDVATRTRYLDALRTDDAVAARDVEKTTPVEIVELWRAADANRKRQEEAAAKKAAPEKKRGWFSGWRRSSEPSNFDEPGDDDVTEAQVEALLDDEDGGDDDAPEGFEVFRLSARTAIRVSLDDERGPLVAATLEGAVDASATAGGERVIATADLRALDVLDATGSLKKAGVSTGAVVKSGAESTKVALKRTLADGGRTSVKVTSGAYDAPASKSLRLAGTTLVLRWCVRRSTHGRRRRRRDR